MKPGKPVAYRDLKSGNWLCPNCWRTADRRATPFYREDLFRTGAPVCCTCGNGIEVDPQQVQEPCVFCDIIACRAPVEWVLRPDFWPDAVAFLPLDPVTEGHCLIAPKVHVRDFAEDPEVYATVSRRAAELMRFSPRPMNVLTTRGAAAGQEVMHLHLHLIPREKGDGVRLLTRRKASSASR